MKTTFIICLLACCSTARAGTLFDQLCAFNPNWKKYASFVPEESERVFLTDRQYIQAHLEFVIPILKNASTSHLTHEQLEMRKHLIDVLSDYRLQGNFPLNYYRSERIPVFIDEHNTHCAVGYLMRETGYENLAQQISKSDNYVWVKDLKGAEITNWQQLSGFTKEELKLIQGAYDSYLPFALDAPNYIEIPQKPEVLCKDFRKRNISRDEARANRKRVWIRGEGTNGVLHGRWEQNFSPQFPWIVGFYQSGEREGKWLEYYRGTNKLCRTEHWKKDKLNGIRTRFNREGDVIEEILFENGQAVLKINYELGESLKYVRKPLRDSLIWTEVYDLAGNRIAAGHETVHNPGNLQWFQNIELTALNTMMSSQSLQLQSISVEGRLSSDNSVRFFEEPPLVEYIKLGDWIYYPDRVDSEKYTRIDNLFSGSFNRLGEEIFPNAGILLTNPEFPVFDSIQVNYSEGNVHRLNGYSLNKAMRMEFEWYSESDMLEAGYYPYDFRRVRTKRNIKSYGSVNTDNDRIGKWYHFNESGYLSRIEEFIPQEVQTRSTFRRRISEGSSIPITTKSIR